MNTDHDDMTSPDKPPLVSVVMSMLNSADTVGATVRSIQLQTLPDWELVVIDNGSSDGSAAVVRGFNDKRIRLFSEISTALLATRLNQAVGLSRGRFIARMDADDICFPERLEMQIARLEKDPELDVVGCGAVVFKNDWTLVGQLPVALTHDEIVARPFIGFPFPHPTWCGRCEWFRDNRYHTTPNTAEDQDLLLRAFRTSKFACLEHVLLGYRQNQLSLRKLMLGRRAFIASLWKDGWRAPQRWASVRGIATHAVKVIADLVLMALGLGQWAQKYRLEAISGSVPERWRQLQRDLKGLES